MTFDGIGRLSSFEELEVGAEAGERGSQLVRRVGHELALRAQRGLELSEHGVEARAEPAELIASPRSDPTGKVARLRHLFDSRRQPFYRRDRGAPDERAEAGRQKNGARREGDKQETCLRERRVDPCRGEVLDDFDRATALNRHDPNGKPRVLRVGCGKERAALAAGDVLYLLKDEPCVRCFEVGSKDCAAGGDDLGVHVRSSRHQLRWRTETAPAVTRARAAAGRVLRRDLQVGFDLMHQLVLHHEVHRDRRADRRDGDSGSREKGYPKSKAHGSFMT